MTVFISALAFILLLSVLVLIHEWGHFAAARRFNVEVEEFGFGLPPRAKTIFSQGGTAFTLNWIPFGGFVRLKGENALTEKERRTKGSFSAASVPARLIILLAGVFMNLLLAIILLTVGFSFGGWVPTFTSFEDMEAAAARGEIHLQMGVLIDDVSLGGGAATAGVPARSVLRSINGSTVTRLNDVTTLQEGKSRATYVISRIQGNEILEETEEFTVTLASGKSGVVIVPFPLELSAPDYSVLKSFLLAFRETRIMTVQTVFGIGKLFTSLVSSGKVPEGIAGIVGIAQLTHSSIQQGFMQYLRLVALLSLSLAVLNVLPFPALDGGRVLFVLIEWITRRPVNRRLELVTNGVGFMVLLALIILITFHDIVRLF